MHLGLQPQALAQEEILIGKLRISTSAGSTTVRLRKKTRLAKLQLILRATAH